MARRPSLADSIEVTVEEHTALTVLPASPAPFNLASYQFPSSSASVLPAPAKPAPAPEPLPFLGRRRSLAESIEVTIEQSSETTYWPAPELASGLAAAPEGQEWPEAPPAYKFPKLSSPTPLSFYPSGGITKPKLAPSPYSSLLFPSARLAPSPTLATTPPPPPLYTRLPRTSAERCFYLGFFCPPIWLTGAWRISHSSIPSHLRLDEHKTDLEPSAVAAEAEEQSWWAAVGLGPEDGEEWQQRAPRIEEAIALWREEELVWARRCAKCFGGAVVLGVMVATVVSGLFR